MLELTGLQDKAELVCSELAYGEQRILEMGIALSTDPDLLLLDEPTAGLNTQESMALVKKMRAMLSGQTIILVEHDMGVVMELADRISVLHYGEILAEGSPEEIKNNEEVKKVYLGRFSSYVISMKEVNCYYGKSHVLNDTTLEIREKELVGLAGRNGVGKTTTLKSIMGLVPPRSGEIRFDQDTLSRLPAYQIPRRGIAYVPQGRHLFPKLTVMENLRIPIVQGQIDQETLEEVFDYFPRLKERLKQKAGTLSGGEQQMLAVGRALIIRPRLILLDEPTEGLMPLLVQAISQTVKAINAKGTTILLVEQNLKTLKDVCHRIYIMEKGVRRL